jgi:hypothetical protein
MDAASQSPKAEARYSKHEAANWLEGRSEDFVSVCLNAGLEPEYVRRMAARALSTGCKWRAEAHSPSRPRHPRPPEPAELAGLPLPSMAAQPGIRCA